MWECEPKEELLSCFHNGLALVRERDFDKEVTRYKYVNKNKKVIYSWEETSSYIIYSARMASASHEEQMLHMYEGTEIYPMLKQRYKSGQPLRGER